MNRKATSILLMLVLPVTAAAQSRQVPESELQWLRANSYQYREPPPPATGSQVFVIGGGDWPYSYPMPRWYRFEYYGPFIHGGIPLGYPAFGSVSKSINRSTVLAPTLRVRPNR